MSHDQRAMKGSMIYARGLAMVRRRNALDVDLRRLEYWRTKAAKERLTEGQVHWATQAWVTVYTHAVQERQAKEGKDVTSADHPRTGPQDV